MAALQRCVELPHSVPLLGNSARINSMVGPVNQASKLPIVLAGIDAIDVLMLYAFDAWIKAPAQDGKRGEVQFRVTMRVRVMLLKLQVAFVIQQTVKHILSISAFMAAPEALAGFALIF